MWPRFGIKVGNSTLCIAYVKASGQPEVIANTQGDRTSQACLLWNGATDIECGLTAKQKMATRPKQAVANCLQLLLTQNEIAPEIAEAGLKEIPCEYDADSSMLRLKTITEDGKGDTKECIHEMAVVDVLTELLRAELELARQYYNADGKPYVVLSIPSYYPMTAWEVLANAAETAGFHVSQIITESSAALLTYFGDNVSESSKFILTIKSGGLFSYFSIYKVSCGLFKEVSSHGPFQIGGRQITEALVQFICEEFFRKYKLDPKESRRSMAKIRTAAANCKHILTTLPSTQIYIDSLMDGVDFNVQMSRARFESLIQPVINSFMQTLNDSIELAMREHSEIKTIDEIVLLGATMQIPKLQSAIGSRFPDAKLDASLPDEAVAKGCARQASFLVDPTICELQKTETIVLMDKDILIWHGNDESQAKELIAKETLLPYSTTLTLSKDKSATEEEIFHLRNENDVRQVKIKEVVAKNDVYKIEVEVKVKPETNNGLLIRLRALE